MFILSFYWWPRWTAMSRKCWWCGRHCASVGTAPLKRQKRVINHPLNTIKCRNPILITCHYPDMGGTSVWACRDGNLFTTNPPKICFNQYHQYGISALILATSLCGEPVLALPACRRLLFPWLHAEKGRLRNAVANRVPASHWQGILFRINCEIISG